MIFSGVLIFGLLFNNFIDRLYVIFVKTNFYLMKKLILSAVMLLGLALSTQAQEISKTL